MVIFSVVIIDFVLNFDVVKGVILIELVDVFIDVVMERGYSVDMILEIYIYVDYMILVVYI